MIDLRSLQVGDRVTMRYPNGILQEAVLVSNDAGMLNFQVGGLGSQLCRSRCRHFPEWTGTSGGGNAEPTHDALLPASAQT